MRKKLLPVILLVVVSMLAIWMLLPPQVVVEYVYVEPVVEVEYYERPGNLHENPEAGWTELLRGNERFIQGEKVARDWVALREYHTVGQWPFASIVSCSDSRFGPEVIFDQGIGDVFIVRTAGNTVAGLALGSLEFSVNVLGTPLIVVLGHEGCGAVYATVDHQKELLDLPFEPVKLVDVVVEIMPAADKAIATEKTGIELREYATMLNTIFVAQEIIRDASGIKGMVAQDEVMVIGAKSMFDGTVVELFRVTGDNLNEFMEKPGCVEGYAKYEDVEVAPEVGICLLGIDPMSGICLQDEFTLKFLPASSTGDLPALKAILEEKERTIAEEGETAMLMYHIGALHFFLADRYFILELGKEGILHHAGEAVRTVERAMELGLEERYLPFAHGYIAGAMGTRALHTGILESLFGLIGFDRHIATALSLGEEFYGFDHPPRSLMYAVRGRRFRDTPRRGIAGLIARGSLSKAMEDFRRAVELDPGFILNYEDIALTYEEMGKNDKAIEYWQKVIELPLPDRHKQWGIEAKERAEEALELLRGVTP